MLRHRGPGLDQPAHRPLRRQGRPGPRARPVRPGAVREISPPEAGVREAIERIRSSQRPVIVVGQGARADIATVIELAELIGAPVITTFKAKGAISDHHPLGCGVLGRSGTPVASWLMNESDLVVAFGASFSNHTGIAPFKPIIQIDHDPMAIGRHHPVEIGLQGAVATTARLLTSGLDGERKCVDQRAVIADRWKIWRDEKASRRSDIGSIGFSFPAAMGASAAVGDTRKVVSVSGDGGFGQYAMEITTAVKYDMNITHVLLNNSELGKISKEQRAGEFDVWQTSLHNPDFAAFAELCGAHGTRVTAADQLHDAITTALAHDGPSIVEVITDPLPM